MVDAIKYTATELGLENSELKSTMKEKSRIIDSALANLRDSTPSQPSQPADRRPPNTYTMPQLQSEEEISESIKSHDSLSSDEDPQQFFERLRQEAEIEETVDEDE
ncbi:hypothetical protein FQA39_LY13701 [Lamprigera yunnana]|nr:hypothetical protein FQA39_LY13701 [Lamprigera yunnana]